LQEERSRSSWRWRDSVQLRGLPAPKAHPRTCLLSAPELQLLLRSNACAAKGAHAAPCRRMQARIAVLHRCWRRAAWQCLDEAAASHRWDWQWQRLAAMSPPAPQRRSCACATPCRAVWRRATRWCVRAPCKRSYHCRTSDKLPKTALRSVCPRGCRFRPLARRCSLQRARQGPAPARPPGVAGSVCDRVHDGGC
jgi:hypothetical protein